MATSEPWKLRFRQMRILQVLRTKQVTPLMRRVTLGGEEMEGIPSGPNVKLVIPPLGLKQPEWPMMAPDRTAIWPAPEKRPSTRTYSVRRFDRERGEIDVDFVMHGEGVASTWAEQAKPGDLIGIGGPGGLTVRDADWYLFAADQTALPALSKILEELPANARGQAFVEVADRDEEQVIEYDADVKITWLHLNGQKAGQSDILEKAFRAAPWPDDKRVFAWLAAEGKTVRSLKTYVRDERSLTRREFLAIGYWRYGLNEVEYHEAHDHDRGEDFHETVREEEQRERDSAHS